MAKQFFVQMDDNISMDIHRIGLQKIDLKDFDTVPDEVLRYAELKDNGRLELFIQRFLNTRSEEIASEFFSRMDYPLRTAIREELIKIIQAPEQNLNWAQDDVKRFRKWRCPIKAKTRTAIP